MSLGRYDIVRAMEPAPWGPVYEGLDAALQRKVVLHTVRVQDLSPRAADEFMARFQADALTASRLLHPGIATVLEAGRADEVAWLATQFAEGETLKARLARGERVPVAAAVAVVLDVLAALGHAHASGIVHRSVRPANIVIDGGRVKLAGFGMACIQQSEATTGARLGALAVGTRYMSPEQVQGRPVDASSDLFSAGVVLYELLTGTRPFEGDNAFAVIQQILTVVPPPPTRLDPSLPAALDGVLARALARNADQRFASAAEFAKALHGHAPARAAAPAPLERPAPVQQDTIALELELEYWKDIKESEEADDFLDFLKSFPRGRFAPLAERRLRRMGLRTA